MPELDFLPQWYIDMNRRKRRLRVQLGISLIVGLLLLGWTLMNRRQMHASQALLEQRQVAVVMSEARVQQRGIQQTLRDQLRTQDRVESSLGVNVEASRILALIGQALPESASILELTLDTDEQNRPLVQQVVSKTQAPALIDRHLNVNLKCVAPANIDVATLLENLTNSGVCENLRLDYAKERIADNMIMREFEIEFKVNLNADGEEK